MKLTILNERKGERTAQVRANVSAPVSKESGESLERVRSELGASLEHVLEQA